MAMRWPMHGALLAVMLLGLPPSADAQFSPQFNHLKCYKISRRCPSALSCSTNSVAKTVTVHDQFGTEQVMVLTPALLCVPTEKTCPDGTTCGEDPTHDPVDHFKCYKVKAPRSTVQRVVRLTDQFGTENVAVTAPNLLCTPVLKEVLLPTTTTTTTSTTTTTTTTTSSTTTTTNPPCVTGGCAPCGTCGNGECHAAGGGGGCGTISGNTPVCVDAGACTPSSCNSDAQCPAGNVCVVKNGAPECCAPCGAPCVAGGCAACGSCGHGECHLAGGGGGCGAPGNSPVCADTSACIASNCSSDAQCPSGRVCIFGTGGSQCCVPCP